MNSRWLIATYIETSLIPIDSLGYLLDKDTTVNLKYMLSVINSKLVKLYYNLILLIKTLNHYILKELSIPNISNEQQKPFIEKADLMLNLNKELNDKKQSFFEWLGKCF
jgi:hypothetical protein